VCDGSADLDRLISPERVAVETERLLGFRCHSVVPITCGADPDSGWLASNLHWERPIRDSAQGTWRCQRLSARDTQPKIHQPARRFAPRLLVQDDGNQALVMEFVRGPQVYESPRRKSPQLLRRLCACSPNCTASRQRTVAT